MVKEFTGSVTKVFKQSVVGHDLKGSVCQVTLHPDARCPRLSNEEKLTALTAAANKGFLKLPNEIEQSPDGNSISFTPKSRPSANTGWTFTVDRKVA